MQNVKALGKCDLNDYLGVIDKGLHEDLHSLAQKLSGIRICHINATSYGGGVAEILHQEIPLAKKLGLNFDWKVMTAPVEFYDVTKKIHNTLQGNTKIKISKEEWALYEHCNVRVSEKLNPEDYDVIFIHDPQPAMLIKCMDKGDAKWIWRCHIDLSEPNKKVEKYFERILKLYDGYIFTMRDYVPKGLKRNVNIISPAIDPLSDKNRILPEAEVLRHVKKLGIDMKRPLITQISRYDPWKDPKGVAEAYKLAKKEIPDLQLVLAGSMADDDPEGKIVFEEIKRIVGDDKDVYLLVGLSDKEINSLQTYSDIIIQKSTKEGFGLTVSEAMWKNTAVIGGNVGGIPTQIKDGENGYLVNNVEECAERVTRLMKDKGLRDRMGKAGREHVRKNFLLPRLLHDELKVIDKLVSTKVRA